MICDGRDDVLHTASAFKNIDTIVTTVTVRKGEVNETSNYSNNNLCGRSRCGSARPYALHGSEKASPSDDVPGTPRGQPIY